ncbi:MAG: hypothetical protein IJ121_09425 [Eubacterium sp.]|nr:hypothetical protein [Eubacterium sp.]
MVKKVSKVLRNNIGLKLLSLVIAVIIWYAVVSVNDPVIARSFSVKITTQNETYIQNGKQLFRIEDDYKTALVYLRANRSTLRDISADDITVTADLTQIVDLDATPVMVPLQVSCPGVDRTNITLSRTAIPITIEEIATKEIAIAVDTGDTKPGSSYEVGRLTANPEKVSVSGPKSVVEDIETIVARIDVTGMTYSARRNADLILYDRDQNELPAATIEDDITFSTESSGVSVEVELWKRQSDVIIQAAYTGEPQAGYQVGAITTNPQTVSVVGSDEALAELKEAGNVISIPAELIDISGSDQDYTTELDLSELMPEDMRIAANTASTAEVTVTILPEGSREFVIDVDDITPQSLNEDLTISYDQTEVTVVLRGNEEILTKLKASDLKPAIDCSSMEEGDYSAALKVTLPADVDMLDTVKITVHVKKAARTD